MDGDGQWTGLADLESRQRGMLDGNFAWRQLLDQRIQFVGMVVARSTYEELGGFRPSLPYCLDWDMWKRIALLGKPIHYEPEPLACYRLHEAAESSRLITTGENVREERRSIAYSCASLPASEATRARRAAAKAAGVRAARRARQLWKKGLRGAAWRSARPAFAAAWRRRCWRAARSSCCARWWTAATPISSDRTWPPYSLTSP